MSVRRRARAGGNLPRDIDQVPPELANPDDAVWTDAGGVERLAEVYGIEYAEPVPSMLRDPFFERFKAFREGYAHRFGFMSEEYQETVDLKRLRAAGIYAVSRAPRWRLLSDGSVAPTSMR